ncbi:MAG: methyltransferase domain-containing protein [Chloroflexi bacterium]|nr:MAG: methyltransferase domain-containing protein [Chloroflexota bacterium]
MPRICDYEGSKYRTEFWETSNRRYEDQVERVAMRRLLPPSGRRILEVGAGFGRLADLYAGYEQVVLMDYARSQMEEAQRYLGRQSRFVFVVADVYRLPFVDNLFDTLTMVRVMHHLVDVPAALAELHRVIAPDGVAVLEHASKRHLKAILRWLLRLQHWNPFDPTPHEFVELNFDFHPAWMREKMQAAGFRVLNTRTVSHFRIDLLKRSLPTAWLVWLDSLAQLTGNWWQLTPSLFLQVQAEKDGIPAEQGFFRCPACGSPNLPPPLPDAGDTVLHCPQCRRGWAYRDGIYDFKTPVG